MCPGLEFAEDALADFRYVLEEYPSFVRAHLNVYAIHKRTGNLKDAEWALAQVSSSWGDVGPLSRLHALQTRWRPVWPTTTSLPSLPYGHVLASFVWSAKWRVCARGFMERKLRLCGYWVVPWLSDGDSTSPFSTPALPVSPSRATRCCLSPRTLPRCTSCE